MTDLPHVAVSDDITWRLWHTAARMALDGVSALEDMLASGAPLPPDYPCLIELLARRVIRVTKEVAGRAPQTDYPA